MASKRNLITLATALAASVSAVACSLLLQDESLPCTSDGDCVKYPGSKCDLSSRICIAGAPEDGTTEAEASSPVADAPGNEAFSPDGTPDVTDASPGDSGLSLDAPPEADGAPASDAADGSVDGADASPDASDASPAIDWTAFTAYLDGLYNAQMHLVQRTPGSGVYNTSPDNALVQRVFAYLPQPDTSKSSDIGARLSSLRICGCSDTPGHDASIDHLFDPLVHRGATIPLSPTVALIGIAIDTSQSGGACPAIDAGASCSIVQHEDHPGNPPASPSWGDSCNSAMTTGLFVNWNASGAGTGYADLIAFEILNYRNRNLATNALWSSLHDKWDGKGINDSADGPSTTYSTYKLALFRLCARALGQPVPAGVDSMLIASQGANGGFRTNYTSNGVFVDTVGNAETAALVALAFLLPTSEI
jgi:hypothetical protein